MDDLMTPEQRRARHQAWLAAFGFTQRDWARIKALAETVSDNHIPAGLGDLDAPYRVQPVPPKHRRWSNGRLLGTYKGRALLYWPLERR